MSNYFRITAYHPAENLSAIIDSNGYFGKLWQFSAHLVKCGFNIIAVGNSDTFSDDLDKVPESNSTLYLRAYQEGKPEINGNNITVSNVSYLTKGGEK